MGSIAQAALLLALVYFLCGMPLTVIAAGLLCVIKALHVLAWMSQRIRS